MNDKLLLLLFIQEKFYRVSKKKTFEFILLKLL